MTTRRRREGRTAAWMRSGSAIPTMAAVSGGGRERGGAWVELWELGWRFGSVCEIWVGWVSGWRVESPEVDGRVHGQSSTEVIFEVI